METLIQDAIFLAFVAVTVIGAAIVAFSPRITHAAFGLLFTFCGVAALYVYLGADFLAATQVMIYVGGILVLLLFGILMTQALGAVGIVRDTRQTVYGGIVSALVCGLLVLVIRRTEWVGTALATYLPTTRDIGRLLLTDYVLPFEIASILLLAALIGAVKIARKEE